MKQILAIIRNEYLAPSLRALRQIGVGGIITFPVSGRGRQNGAPAVPDLRERLGRDAGLHLRRSPAPGSGRILPAARLRKRQSSPPLVPRQLLLIMVEDGETGPVVQVLIDTNQTGRSGDGKIFVCPVGHALDIGTRPAH